MSTCFYSRMLNFHSVDTITDLLHNFGELVRFPTLTVLEGINSIFPKVIYFFEGDCQTGSGVGGIIVGFILYWIIFSIISSEVNSKKS